LNLASAYNSLVRSLDGVDMVERGDKKELGRRWIGIEVNPAYVEICWKRVAQGVLPLVPNAGGEA